MATTRYDNYVHRLSDGRWIVAEHSDGEYRAYMHARVARLTGATMYMARTPDGLPADFTYCYRRRSDALRRARELYPDRD